MEYKMAQTPWIWQFLKQLNIELPHDPAIPLPGIYSREIKTYVHIKSCTQMFIVALFVIAMKTTQKSTKDERINQM